MSQRATEDKDDIFIENLNTVLFLAFGILATVASAGLFGYSAIAFVYGQQLSMNLLATPIFAALLLATGLGSMYLFRRRRQLTKKKTDSPF